MERRAFFLMAAGSVAALMSGALAEPRGDRDHGDRGRGGRDDHGGHGGGRDEHGGGGHDEWRGRQSWHWRDDRGGWHNDRDRYWQQGYGNRRYVDRDRIFSGLRRRRYTRFSGDPYWFQGSYVVRTYDRWGNTIFVEINPYTGDFIGILRF